MECNPDEDDEFGNFACSSPPPMQVHNNHSKCEEADEFSSFAEFQPQGSKDNIRDEHFAQPASLNQSSFEIPPLSSDFHPFSLQNEQKGGEILAKSENPPDSTLDDDFGDFAAFDEADSVPKDEDDEFGPPVSANGPPDPPPPECEVPSLETVLESGSLWEFSSDSEPENASDSKVVNFTDWDADELQVESESGDLKEALALWSSMRIIPDSPALKMEWETSAINRGFLGRLGIQRKGQVGSERSKIESTNSNLPQERRSFPPRAARCYKPASDVSSPAASLLSRLPQLGFLRSKDIVFPQG